MNGNYEYDGSGADPDAVDPDELRRQLMAMLMGVSLEQESAGDDPAKINDGLRHLADERQARIDAGGLDGVMTDVDVDSLIALAAVDRGLVNRTNMSDDEFDRLLERFLESDLIFHSKSVGSAMCTAHTKIVDEGFPPPPVRVDEFPAPASVQAVKVYNPVVLDELENVTDEIGLPDSIRLCLATIQANDTESFDDSVAGEVYAWLMATRLLWRLGDDSLAHAHIHTAAAGIEVGKAERPKPSTVGLPEFSFDPLDYLIQVD